MGTATPFRAAFGIQFRAVTYVDSATITPNANTSDICILTSLSQATLIANPIVTNPYDGQLLQIRISSTVSRAISFDTGYQSASSLALSTATTGGGKEDYISFRYNSLDVKWDLISSTIAVAGSISAWRQITQNISPNARTSGNFVVTTTGLVANSQVLVMQATGVGANIDDIEWDGIVANGFSTSTTQFTCYWSASSPVSGTKRFNYLQV